MPSTAKRRGHAHASESMRNRDFDQPVRRHEFDRFGNPAADGGPPDAALLWQGAYPPDVAELLVQQYEGMGIARVEVAPERVLLQSSASPIPMAVLRVDGEWRVDASPIIEFRKRARRHAEALQQTAAAIPRDTTAHSAAAAAELQR